MHKNKGIRSLGDNRTIASPFSPSRKGRSPQNQLVKLVRMLQSANSQSQDVVCKVLREIADNEVPPLSSRAEFVLDIEKTISPISRGAIAF